jgi:hypothetical protein
MFGRILGVLTFKRAKYLEIAKDTRATGQAVILVLVSALLTGLIEAYIVTGNGLGAGESNISAAIGRGAASFVSAFIVWIVTAALLSLIAWLFKGKTTVGEMLRVTGFVEVFGILACLICLALALAGSASAADTVKVVIGVLALAGYLLGVSETAGITVGKALITALAAGFIGFFVGLVITELILSVSKIPAA